MTGDKLAVAVVVGTDKHPFDRLMGWLERWHARRMDEPAMLVQYGNSRPPALAGARPFLGHDEVRDAMVGATLVVCHGGPATIVDARRAGHLPIVVARDPSHGEHVDDHQMRFVRRMAELEVIHLCETEADLMAALDRGLAMPSHFMLGQDDGDWSRARSDAAAARVGEIVEQLVAGRSARRARWWPR